MRDDGFIRMPLAAFMVALVVGTLVPACRAGGANKQVPPEQQKRLEAMQAEGTKASLTVFPVVMGDGAKRRRGRASAAAGTGRHDEPRKDRRRLPPAEGGHV